MGEQTPRIDGEALRARTSWYQRALYMEDVGRELGRGKDLEEEEGRSSEGTSPAQFVREGELS